MIPPDRERKRENIKRRTRWSTGGKKRVNSQLTASTFIRAHAYIHTHIAHVREHANTSTVVNQIWKIFSSRYSPQWRLCWPARTNPPEGINCATWGARHSAKTRVNITREMIGARQDGKQTATSAASGGVFRVTSTAR